MTNCRFLPVVCLSLFIAARCAGLTAADLSVEKSDRGVTVKADGQVFTEYLFKSGAKPVLWPVIGPTGKPLTRSYPLASAGEPDSDHVHQRSMWFTHGSVNGIDFWAESSGHGSIVHRELVTASGGRTARLVTRNDWIAPDGKRVLEDRRTLTFEVQSDWRSIDFDIELIASDVAVTFGDTKEGTFGIRVASTMRQRGGGGRIVSSEGKENAAAWGQRAAWVDYQGPVNGKSVGIAILNHPSSFRHPTWWHVRDYGLFAANPFGLKDFGAGESGQHVLAKGQTLKLAYRVLLHVGDEKEAKITDRYSAYANEPRPK